MRCEAQRLSIILASFLGSSHWGHKNANLGSLGSSLCSLLPTNWYFGFCSELCRSARVQLHILSIYTRTDMMRKIIMVTMWCPSYSHPKKKCFQEITYDIQYILPGFHFFKSMAWGCYTINPTVSLVINQLSWLKPLPKQVESPNRRHNATRQSTEVSNRLHPAGRGISWWICLAIIAKIPFGSQT